MSTIKILCFAILGMSYCEIHGMLARHGQFPNFPAAVVGAPIVDFDTIFGNANPMIPEAFQPKQYNNPIAGAPNRRCVYFTVINNAPGAVPPAPANFHNAHPTPPNPANEHNIYFPADGSQPTTPEAVEYSCANIDNRPDSPITEWYMKMFGVIDRDGGTSGDDNEYIKAGWSAPAGIGGAITEQRVISFDANCSGHPHNNCSVVNYGNTHVVNDPNIPGAQISRRALFEREFRKIASTSVGRVLLYRILIEIRRHIANNVGAVENQAFVGNTAGTRNEDRCRSIEIAYDGEGLLEGFGFSDMDRKIIFANNPNTIADQHTPFSVIGRSRKDGYTHIVQAPIELDTAICHEIIHWFHHLRNPKRNFIEVNSDKSKHFNDISLSRYYWNGIDYCFNSFDKTREQHYAKFWSTGFPSHLNFEEMRTVLGMPHNTLDEEYLNGDDLSENLYRSGKGILLRFGYDGDTFYEDRKVIDRVVNATINNYIVYITGKDSYVNFQYNTGIPGFGKCKVSH